MFGIYTYTEDIDTDFYYILEYGKVTEHFYWSSLVKIILAERTAKNIFKIADTVRVPRTKSLYLPMNENQHVGKVGNAYARHRKYACGQKRLASLPQSPDIRTPVESTAICAITFSVFLSRVIRVSTHIRHDGILPSKTAETLPHKSAGPQGDLFIC